MKQTLTLLVAALLLTPPAVLHAAEQRLEEKK